MAISPDDRRRTAAAAQRNREPILAVLKGVLPAEGSVLEVACGTGEHAAWFAGHFPSLVWIPSDPDPTALESAASWAAQAGGRVQPPIALDVRDEPWPLPDGTEPLSAILAINLIHIAPWTAAVGLMRGAARHLDTDGVLYLYGAYRRGGEHTSPSNVEFDAMLRSRDPDWGVRDLEDVEALANSHGLVLDRVVEMPANNLSVTFRKDDDADRLA